MLRTLRGILLALLLLPLAACDTPSTVVVALDEGELRGETYHHPGLGWTMPLPSGWRVLTTKEVEVLTGKGKAMLEKSIGAPIENLSTDLLYLKHGPASSFTSSRQPHDETVDGPYPELQQTLFEAVAQSYRDAGIVIETKRGRETIDGVAFEWMHVRLLSPDGRKEIAQQTMFDGRIGEQGMTVSVTAKLASERKEMLAAWRASRFTPVAAGPAATEAPVPKPTP